jgi:hypothetical protein
MKDYLLYLKDVLGVQNVMLSQPPEAPALGSQFGLDLKPQAGNSQFFSLEGPLTQKEPQHFELIFINILTQAKESLFNPEVQELFAKMKTAMKIGNIQWKEVDCTVEDRSQLPSAMAEMFEAKIVVVFSSFPKDMGELIFKGPGKWIETYSPAYLLEDAAAKKVVWNDLQKVMRELGL